MILKHEKFSQGLTGGATATVVTTAVSCYLFHGLQCVPESDHCLYLAIILFISVLTGFGGLVVSMLASGTQDRGLEAVGFFGRKNPQHAFLVGEVKPSPMSQICAASQRTLGLRGSRNHRQN